MGTWMNGTKHIAERIFEMLNEIEGDFTDAQLQEALEIIKLYPFVCDKRKSIPKFKKAMKKLT